MNPEKEINHQKMCQMLGVESEKEYSIILWKSPQQPPEEASYVLIKYLEENGQRIECADTAYEGGKFLSFYPDGDVREINEKNILGWSYYSFDDRVTK